MMGFAMLGAGLIVPDCWLPVFRFAPDCKAHWGDDGLDAILADPRVRAVVIALPAQAQLQIAAKALAAGKHVLQEKPIGATMQEAVDLLTLYKQQYSSKLIRSENVFLRAREIVQGLGKIIKVDLIADMPMSPANKYFTSEWRRDLAGFPGGYVTDSGVHYIAAMRTIAKTAGCGEITKASGFALSTTDQLPPPDTLVGYAFFQDGTPATISFSFSAAQVRFSLSFVGTKGSLEVQRGGWGISRGEYTLQYKRDTDSGPIKEPCSFSGFPNEVESFAAAAKLLETGLSPLEGEEVHYRVSCVEGARDQAVIEAMLTSSKEGGKLVDVMTL